MGIVHRGIPQKKALELKKKWGLKQFCETGTHVGKSARWAGDHFDHVVTIESSPEFYWKAYPSLINPHKFTPILGDSRTELAAVIQAGLNITPCLFWLDSHWSRDLGYARPSLGECPVLEELRSIIQFMEETHVIMIDDSRFFTSPPPKPHRASDWPTYKQIKDLFPPRKHSSWKPHPLEIFEDVIIIIREKIE